MAHVAEKLPRFRTLDITVPVRVSAHSVPDVYVILYGIVRPHLATLVDDFRRHGQQRAVVVHRGNRQYTATYADLANLSEGFAAELIHRQIHPGDRVVLWGENSAEWIAVFFGCVLRGVLVVPLDSIGGLEFARRVIAETEPRLVVGDQSLLSTLGKDDQSAGAPCFALEELANLPSPPFDAPLLEPSLSLDTPLQILFTSGTTSTPKGVVHTHRNVLASLDPIEREMQKYLRYERIFHPLRFLHTLPLSHVFGQFMGLWIPPLLAAELHFENRLQSLRLLELIHRHRISVLASVPRVLDLLKANLEQQFPGLTERRESARPHRIWNRWWALRDVHRAFGFKFWALVCGGASLDPSLERFWNDLGFALIQGYGMTETAALITLNHPFHIGQGTIGKPLPGREVRIAPDGEVLVRGDMVATSRWRNGHLESLPDPWLATGDLVAQDPEGQLRFLGRKTEVIVTAAGLNIHPEDIEAALNRQSDVEASAVVAFESSAGTEHVAVLVFRGSPAQAQSAIDAANATLADYQRIRRWMLWPELDFPRTSSGKIQRPKITQWITTQIAQSASIQIATDTASDTAADPLSALLASITRSRPIRLSDEARLDSDLNLDSLARVQLQTELEQRLGVTIPDGEFERLVTVGDLRARLGFKPAASIPTRNNGDASAHEPSPRELFCPPDRFIYPRWTWSFPIRIVRTLFHEIVMRPLVWFLAAPQVVRNDVFRSQVTQGDFSRPGDLHAPQPLLLISNHVTAYDAPLILYALPASMRHRVAVAMSGEMLDDWRHARNQGHWLLDILAPIQYWLVTALFNVFPLPRSAGFRRSFAYAGEAMDNGYHVLVFPEGHRSADGALEPFRPGIALLARESKAQILPIALKGLGDLKRRRKNWFRSRLLQIRIGAPLALDPQLSPEALAQTLHEVVSTLLESGCE